MDPTSKSTGTTILGKIQNGCHLRTIIIITLQPMDQINDVNINFIYFEVNGFIDMGLGMIRVIYFMFRPFLAFLRQKYIKFNQSTNPFDQVWP